MSRAIAWKDVAELIGVVAIVGSLIFVGLELTQARQIALSEGDMATASVAADLQDQIQTNAEIWQKGASGSETLDAVEAVVFESIVVSMSSFWFNVYNRRERIEGAEQAAGARRTFAFDLYTYPGARSAWLAREDRLLRAREALNPGGANYSEWRDAVVEDLRVLDEAGL